MIKVIDQIDFRAVRDYYLSIEDQIVWNDAGAKGKQTSIQYAFNEDPWSSSNGKDMGNQMRFNLINPFFENSIIEEIVKKFNLTRARFMWLNSMSCYSIHKDMSPRINIPIITNPRCYFLFEDQAPIHLELGNVYWIDTRKEHTAINCSHYSRLHIIGAVSS